MTPFGGAEVDGSSFDKATLLWFLVFASEFHFYGHGYSCGALALANGSRLTVADLLWVAAMRLLFGTGKLSQADLASCYSLSTAAAVNAWLNISNMVTGYSGVTASGDWRPWTWSISPKLTFRNPITYDPGAHGSKGKPGKDKATDRKSRKEGKVPGR